MKTQEKFDYHFSKAIENKVATLSSREKSYLFKVISESVTRYTRTLALIAVFYYSLISLMHPVFLSGWPMKILMTLGVSTLCFCLYVYLGIRSKRISIYLSRWYLWLIIAAGITNTFTHVFVTQDHIQLSLAAIIPIVVGLLSFDRRGFFSLNFISLGLFAYAITTVEGAYGAHFSFMYILSLFMSYIAYAPRIDNHVGQLILGIKDRSRSILLKLRSQEAEKSAADAKKSSEVKSKFLANVSHELRTPLTGVSGMIDLIEKGNKDASLSALISHAHESSRLLMTLINDILDFSKMEAGTLSLNPKPASLNQVSMAVINMMSPTAKSKAISLIFEQTGSQPETDSVMVDSVRLSQILFNYVGNALKFTDQGSVKMIMDIKDQKDSLLVTWSVIDSGAGIHPDAQALLFKRFQQSVHENESQTVVEGAGLGLAISKEIAELMGGEVGVESAPGLGSTFKLQATFQKAKLERQKEIDYLEKLQGQKKLKILLAEDNRINRLLIGKLLANINVDLDEAEDGSQALQKVTENTSPYDLIMTDVRMPVMGGVDLAVQLRDKGISTPIIFITANSQEDEINSYWQVGMNGFIGKPIDPHEFYKVIYDSIKE
ncbi:response regulator [Temperatibacter marinus]|uniref:histidine kinase n=1 Tax=Temperatibacter marinus TaxID=1456591 RepID=A0AA52EFZ5_9PROT|nr:response regulator [Temperatibacter marinus]WND01827.1 response regulator [Temperatibacter marinus]